MSRFVLVTGASGGIGSAVVEAFAAAGFGVVATDLRARAGRWTRFVEADLAEVDEVDSMVRSIAATEGRLDVVVNNAAIQWSGRAEEMNVQEWDRLLAVNLRAPFLIACAARPLLAAHNGGSMVNIASVHARATSWGLAAYAASKGGLVALTRAMAIEWAADGVRVNAVLPGAVDTEMLEAGLSRASFAAEDLDARKRRLAELTPIGRLGSVMDIAQAVLFLADDQRSGFITGESLVVDGGAVARLSTE